MKVNKQKRQATGIVKQRKEITSSVNGIGIRVIPHPKTYNVRHVLDAYIVSPITEVIGDNVVIKYIVLNVIPLSKRLRFMDFETEDGYIFHHNEEYVSGYIEEDNSMFVTCNRKIAHMKFIGGLFHSKDNAIQWANIISNHFEIHNKIAKAKMVTHILKLNKLLKDM